MTDLNSFEINRMHREQEEAQQRVRRGIQAAMTQPESIEQHLSFALGVHSTPEQVVAAVLHPSGRQTQLFMRPQVARKFAQDILDEADKVGSPTNGASGLELPGS